VRTARDDTASARGGSGTIREGASAGTCVRGSGRLVEAQQGLDVLAPLEGHGSGRSACWPSLEIRHGLVALPVHPRPDFGQHLADVGQLVPVQALTTCTVLAPARIILITSRPLLIPVDAVRSARMRPCKSAVQRKGTSVSLGLLSVSRSCSAPAPR